MTPSTTDGEERANSLDERLREIITDRFGFSETIGDGADDVIAQIKQAFAEEHKINGLDFSIWATELGLMTGQHWYDRYLHELTVYLNSAYGAEQNPLDFETEQKSIPIIRTHEAAKRAAGITNEA